MSKPMATRSVHGGGMVQAQGGGCAAFLVQLIAVVITIVGLGLGVIALFGGGA